MAMMDEGLAVKTVAIANSSVRHDLTKYIEIKLFTEVR